jgi:hypothetical protein
MDFDKLIHRALSLRRQYAARERELHGAALGPEDVARSLLGDATNLVRLEEARSGKRSIANLEETAAASLAHTLWAVIVLADSSRIDLERSFFEAMDRLEAHLLESD